MSIIRSGIPKEFSFTSNESFRLNDSTSTAESVQNGEDFAKTISYISKGEFSPQKASYPRFRKIFYEDSTYNPSIANAHQIGYGHNAHQIEQQSHWSKKGNVMSLEERFPDAKPQNEIGPVKSASYPHFFENSVKYFGRNRQLQPFQVARQYTKPLDRVDHETLRRIEEDKAKAGPGTYKPPDYWEKLVYGSVAEPLRPSAMMEIKEKRDIYMYYNIPDYTELKKDAKNRVIEQPYHSQRGKMSTLLQTSSPSKLADSNINVIKSGSPKKKLYQAVSKSRMRGAKFPDSKLDYNYRGVPHDTQFVRLKKPDGEVFIAPTLISSERPQDEIVLAGTEKVPVWGDVFEKKDIYCLPTNSKTDMFSDDGASAQQDVYTLKGDVVELHVGKIIIPKVINHLSSPISAVKSRKPAPNSSSTRPQTSPDVICTPHLTNRSLMYKDLRKRKKYSTVNTPEVLLANQIPLSTSDKYSLVKKEGLVLAGISESENNDFKHMLMHSSDIVELFNV